MLFKAVPFGLLGALFVFLRMRPRKERAAQVRTWPSREEFEQMDTATLNAYLASKGATVSVVDDPEGGPV